MGEAEASLAEVLSSDWSILTNSLTGKSPSEYEEAASEAN
jgi:hypothetical protein